MSFSNDQQLELQASGQATWDAGLNANFAILERGQHLMIVAGSAVNSGQVCWVNSAGVAVPYNAASLNLREPHVLAPFAVSSGAAGQFLAWGAVRSMGAVWSGQIVPGLPVYVNPASPGMLVSSYAGASYPAGLALRNDAVSFRPGWFHHGEHGTQVKTVGPVLVGSFGDFDIQLGNRGWARLLNVIAQSCDAFKVRFWSGSSRVSSELLYETQTNSTSVGSVDIRTLNFLDAAGFWWQNTDVTSPALVFGRISCQSGSSVNSSFFSVEVRLERFR